MCNIRVHKDGMPVFSHNFSKVLNKLSLFWYVMGSRLVRRQHLQKARENIGFIQYTFVSNCLAATKKLRLVVEH